MPFRDHHVFEEPVWFLSAVFVNVLLFSEENQIYVSIISSISIVDCFIFPFRFILTAFYVYLDFSTVSSHFCSSESSC
jgi:hypothetical protein